MLHAARKQIDAIGGETVQPVDTMVIAPFLVEWAPREPMLTPCDSNSGRFSLMTLPKKSWTCCNSTRRRCFRSVLQEQDAGSDFTIVIARITCHFRSQFHDHNCKNKTQFQIAISRSLFQIAIKDTHRLYWSLPGNKDVFDVAMSGMKKDTSQVPVSGIWMACMDWSRRNRGCHWSPLLNKCL